MTDAADPPPLPVAAVAKDPALDPAVLQRRLNARLALSLPTLSLVLVAILLADAVGNLLTLPANQGMGILAVDAGAALVFLVVALHGRHRPVAPSRAHPLAVVLEAVVLLNLYASTWIDPPGNLVVYNILIVVGMATILLDPRWFGASVAMQAVFGLAGAWAGVPVGATDPLPPLEAALLAVGVFTVRYRALRDLEEAQARLEARVDELGRTNAELERFAYVASHDLQEPLRSVTSYVQLLERRYGPALDDEGREFIGYAVGGAKRMKSLIQDLLAFSRVGHDGRPDELVPLDEAARAVLVDLEPAVQESGGQVTLAPLPTVRGNPRELRAVLQNLLTNALKFHEAHDPPRVEVTARRQDGAWEVAVADHGLGVPPGYRERVFVAFQRLHGGDRYPGTGIGLAFCRKVVERHGGRIWMEETPGGGCTVRFTVPAVEETAGGSNGGSPSGKPRSPTFLARLDRNP